MLDNRIGKFTISYLYLQTNKNDILTLMGNMIIVRAESLFHENVIEYIAYSELFDEIEQGLEIPSYIIYSSNDGSVRAERVKFSAT